MLRGFSRAFISRNLLLLGLSFILRHGMKEPSRRMRLELEVAIFAANYPRNEELTAGVSIDELKRVFNFGFGLRFGGSECDVELQ